RYIRSATLADDPAGASMNRDALRGRVDRLLEDLAELPNSVMSLPAPAHVLEVVRVLANACRAALPNDEVVKAIIVPVTPETVLYAEVQVLSGQLRAALG